jgi:hypothetical protein
MGSETGERPIGSRLDLLFGRRTVDRSHAKFSPYLRRKRMKPLRFTDRFKTLFSMAIRLSETVEADGVLILLDGSADWNRLRKLADGVRIMVAADTARGVGGSERRGLLPVVVNMPDSPVYDRLTQALLEAVADDLLVPGSRVVALYSGFDQDTIDSVSVINLGEHLGSSDRARPPPARDACSAGDSEGRGRSGGRDRSRGA